MPLRSNSLGKRSATDRDTCVLVQGLSVSRRRQRNGQCLFPQRVFHGDRKDERLSKRRRQWEPDAPTILSVVWDPALQRSPGTVASDLRARWHFRRSGSRYAGGDDLDVICAPMGRHGRGIAEGGKAATAGGVMSDAQQRMDRQLP